MNSQAQADQPGHPISPRLASILQEFKGRVAEKYPLAEMRLFGSVARGQATCDSDLDIFLRLPSLSRIIEEDVYDMAYELELKYDCLIDVILLSDRTLAVSSGHLPIYQNILRDGVLI